MLRGREVVYHEDRYILLNSIAFTCYESHGPVFF